MIKQVENKEIWNDYLNKLSPHTFLHSWNWAEFNTSYGNKTWRLGVYENETLVGIALALRVNARRGSFLFCPHGPLLENQKYLKDLVEHLKDLAKQENVSFIRFSPLYINTPENQKLFKDLGFRDAPIHMHSELGWMLDITPSEEELLANMRKTTRYSIRKAQSDGVEIIKLSDTSQIDTFYQVFLETTKRQKFTPYSKDYVQKEFDAFAIDNEVLFIFGKHQGVVLSTIMVIFTNNGAFYHHGANIPTKVPVSYLVQWEAIKEAKARGATTYNFWGIAPPDRPNHPWAGITLFKQGFGGFSEQYVHAQDLVLKPTYWATWAVETIRKARRNL